MCSSDLKGIGPLPKHSNPSINTLHLQLVKAPVDNRRFCSVGSGFFDGPLGVSVQEAAMGHDASRMLVVSDV